MWRYVRVLPGHQRLATSSRQAWSGQLSSRHVSAAPGPSLAWPVRMARRRPLGGMRMTRPSHVRPGLSSVHPGVARPVLSVVGLIAVVATLGVLSSACDPSGGGSMPADTGFAQDVRCHDDVCVSDVATCNRATCDGTCVGDVCVPDEGGCDPATCDGTCVGDVCEPDEGGCDPATCDGVCVGDVCQPDEGCDPLTCPGVCIGDFCDIGGGGGGCDPATCLGVCVGGVCMP